MAREPEPGPSQEVLELRAQVEQLQRDQERLEKFVAKIRAELAEPGAITKTEIRADLAWFDSGAP